MKVLQIALPYSEYVKRPTQATEVIDGLKTMTLVGSKTSTDSRIANVTNCYENYGSSAEFIEGALNQSKAN